MNNHSVISIDLAKNVFQVCLLNQHHSKRTATLATYYACGEIVYLRVNGVLRLRLISPYIHITPDIAAGEGNSDTHVNTH
jgi:hypothetical protein